MIIAVRYYYRVFKELTMLDVYVILLRFLHANIAIIIRHIAQSLAICMRMLLNLSCVYIRCKNTQVCIQYTSMYYYA